MNKKIDWNKVDAIPEDSYDYDEAPELDWEKIAEIENTKLLLKKIKPLVWYNNLNSNPISNTFTQWGKIEVWHDQAAQRYNCFVDDAYLTSSVTFDQAKLNAEKHYKNWVLNLFDLGEE